MRGLLLAAVAALAAATVLDLTPESVDDVIGKDKGVFVKFFAPWCGHCKAMAADYETVAATFKASDPVIIAEVNADNHKDLAGKYGVRGYPTLKWFPAGATEPEDFNGGRSAEDIINFVNEKAGTSRRLAKAPSAVLELSASNFDAHIMQGDALNKHRLVEYYATWCGHCKSLAPTYEKVGAAFDGESKVVVAKIDADKHRAVGERFGVTGFPTLKYFAPGSTEAVDYSGGRDGEAFVKFLNEKAGTHRRLDGSLGEEAGRLPAFDALAAKFVAADKAGKAAVIAEAKEAAAALETAEAKAAADVYVKAMGRAADKGDAWFAKERARLEGMAASESIPRAKKYDFLAKRNVLAAFVAAE